MAVPFIFSKSFRSLHCVRSISHIHVHCVLTQALTLKLCSDHIRSIFSSDTIKLCPDTHSNCVPLTHSLIVFRHKLGLCSSDTLSNCVLTYVQSTFWHILKLCFHISLVCDSSVKVRRRASRNIRGSSCSNLSGLHCCRIYFVVLKLSASVCHRSTGAQCTRAVSITSIQLQFILSSLSHLPQTLSCLLFCPVSNEQ
jgi:hypothetical protein